MCIFAAGAGIAGALSALGTLIGAAGSIASGISANNVAKYNAEVAQNNANAERQRAAYEADITRGRVRQVIGAQRAAGAASGLDVRSGTPIAVLGDTAKSGELDVLARLYQGESAAVAYENDARRMRAEGKAQQMGGFINAGTSLLSGFGNLAAKNYSRRYNPMAS
jgi:hypothetical protein